MPDLRPLLRTSTFRLTLAYLGVVLASVIGILAVVALSTAHLIDRHTVETVAAETAGLMEQYREQGLSGLGAAVASGVAQSLALAPGGSRSGITITAGRFLGLDRDSAARVSFVLLVPIVLGAVLLKGVQDVLLGDLPAGSTGPFVVGTLAAAASGLLAIDGLLGYVRRHDYSVFVWYRLLAAAIVLLLIATGVRSAGF